MALFRFRSSFSDTFNLSQNYDFCFGSTFPDPFEDGISVEEKTLRLVRLECRGILFDKNSGSVICRRLHKFHNLGEVEENSVIDLSKKHVVVEKLDGCMISACFIGGELRLISKNGPTELSLKIEETLESQHPRKRWKDLSKDWIAKGYSPTFEWISSDNKIVLTYDHSDLVLIAIRNMRTGMYLSHSDLEVEAKKYGLSAAKLLWNSEDEGKLDLKGLVKKIKSEEGLEGCVLKFEEHGRWFKVKKSSSFLSFVTQSVSISFSDQKRLVFFTVQVERSIAQYRKGTLSNDP